MAYDEDLASRVRGILKRRRGFAEKKMFGGVCFLLKGNMCCGVTRNKLMLRLGTEGAQAALSEPNIQEMDFTGRPMKSMVYLDSDGYASGDQVNDWVRRAAEFCRSLPPK